MALGDMNFLFSLSGLAVGIIVGMTGVGGGSLMTPLLVLLFGIHPATAVGTDLLYAAATKSVGTAVHGGRNKSIDWQIVKRLASGSVPATLATFAVMQALGVQSSKGGVLAFLLGAVLLVTSVTLLFRTQIVAFFAGKIPSNDSVVAGLTVLTGVMLGVLVTTTSVGAGAIGVTALLVLYPRLPTLRIVGSDIAHAVPLTLISGLGHWYLGDVDFLLLGTLLIGSIPGIIIGSYLAPKLPEAVLRMLLAVILVLVSFKLMGAF